MRKLTIAMTIAILGTLATAASADLGHRYTYRHCGHCVERIGNRWQQKHVTTHKRVFAGYRSEFTGYKRVFNGNRRVFSHYRWEWRTTVTHSFPPARIHRRVKVPVYRTIATYRNVPTYRKVPVYRTQPVTVLKWVKVPYRYWECYR